jgi:hypothetical protein
MADKAAYCLPSETAIFLLSNIQNQITQSFFIFWHKDEAFTINAVILCIKGGTKYCMGKIVPLLN